MFPLPKLEVETFAAYMRRVLLGFKPILERATFDSRVSDQGIICDYCIFSLNDE